MINTREHDYVNCFDIQRMGYPTTDYIRLVRPAVSNLVSDTYVPDVRTRRTHETVPRVINVTYVGDTSSG